MKLRKCPVLAINLKNRQDRRRHILSEFEKRSEFELHIVEAVKNKIGAIGLWKSIIKCIEFGKQRNEEFIVICEDDHAFTENYNKSTFQNALNNVQNKDAQILLGGVSWFEDIIFHDNNLAQVLTFSGTQFMVVFKQTYEKILNTEFREFDIADKKIYTICDRIFLMHPFISVQKDFGYSDATSKNNKIGQVDALFKDSVFAVDVMNKLYHNYLNIEINTEAIDRYDLNRITIPTYVINLKNRKEKRRHIRKQFENKEEFEVTIVQAVEHEVGALGLWMSIRKVIASAIDREDDVIIICEDDHQFTEHYQKDKFLRQVILAQAYGAEYLSGGCSYFNKAIPVKEKLYWVSSFQATQFIILYKPAFQKILDEPFDETIVADLKLSEMFSNKMILYPGISIQKDFGYSDVTSLHNQNPKLVRNMFEKTKKRLQKIDSLYHKIITA